MIIYIYVHIKNIYELFTCSILQLASWVFYISNA